MAADGKGFLGGFRIIQSIRCGAGSQGTLFKAVCEDGVIVPRGAAVALKVMPVREDGIARTKRIEAATSRLSRISHPNIVRYFGCFTEHDSFNDLLVIVQEFLDGETLKDRLARFPYGLDADECVHVARSVLSALECVSLAGMVHRDIKPGNIFLCGDGAVKLIDFEVARIEGEVDAAPSGDFMGSFDYMAPEFSSTEFCGDVQSDVFSTGVVLHEMLTGRLPYRVGKGSGDANFEFLSRWSPGGVSPVRIDPKIRHLLGGAQEVLSRALSPERGRRYGGPGEFSADLSRVRMRNIRNGGSTYQLLQFVGKGGFGEVFKARIVETGGFVAVKHLLKAEYAKRFEREAKIMSRLDNPCFVRFVDFFYAAGKEGKEAFLVMDFLDGMPGSSLRDAIKNANGGGLGTGEVLRAFARYAYGLSLMHSRGIYHRDIKPSNLYYPAGRPENAAIMDLGIARDANGTVTTGQVPGTLDYMPPEVVVAGSRGEGGMDVYALGLCLYEALTGKTAYPRLPAGAAGYAAFFSRAREKTPPDLGAARRACGGGLYLLLKEMTEPDLSRRIKDAGTVARRIDGLLADSGSRQMHVPPRMPDSRPASGRAASGRPEPARPTPRNMRPARSAPPRPRTPARGRKTFIRVFFAIAAAAALAGAFWTACGKTVNRKWAEYELDGVIGSWQEDNAAAAEGVEARWFSRWSPSRRGWRGVTAGDYAVLTNRLVVAKERMRNERAARELELARMSERRICVERLAKCRNRDGSLNEECYMAIDGWSLPDWLDGDREVEIRLSGMDRCVFAAIKAKLAVEPVETRPERIRTASALLRNSWTKRLLPEQDAGDAESAIDAVSKWCAVAVSNACSDIVAVDGKEIAIGGLRTMLFKDGRSDTRKVERDGYLPVNLPKGLDGKTFAVSDEMFEAMPAAVELPFFENGVSCRIGDMACLPGETISLKPGSYECVYSKKDFKDQRIPFTVHVKVETVVPEPGRWERTEDYENRRKTIDGAREKLMSDPVTVSVPRLAPGVACLIDGQRREWGSFGLRPGNHRCRFEREGCEPQEIEFEVKPGEPLRLNPPAVWETLAEADERKRRDNMNALKDAVRSKCGELWGNEPVEDRQTRLEAAGVRVAKAIYDGVLAEDEAKPLLDEINRRKKWAVGKVKNDCSVPITVGGRRIDAKTTSVVVFENGIPDDWFLEAPGCERKELLRDFDGCALSFDNLDLVPLDVEVSVPPLAPGVICLFEGAAVSKTIRLKPGVYSCIYRRRGCEDQTVRFEVRPSNPMALPPPSAWKTK